MKSNFRNGPEKSGAGRIGNPGQPQAGGQTERKAPVDFVAAMAGRNKTQEQQTRTTNADAKRPTQAGGQPNQSGTDARNPNISAQNQSRTNAVPNIIPPNPTRQDSTRPNNAHPNKIASNPTRQDNTRPNNAHPNKIPSNPAQANSVGPNNSQPNNPRSNSARPNPTSASSINRPQGRQEMTARTYGQRQQSPTEVGRRPQAGGPANRSRKIEPKQDHSRIKAVDPEPQLSLWENTRAIHVPLAVMLLSALAFLLIILALAKRNANELSTGPAGTKQIVGSYSMAPMPTKAQQAMTQATINSAKPTTPNVLERNFKVGEQIKAGTFCLVSEDESYFRVTREAGKGSTGTVADKPGASTQGGAQSGPEILLEGKFRNRLYIKLAEGMQISFNSGELYQEARIHPEPDAKQYGAGMYSLGVDLAAGNYRLIPQKGKVASYRIILDALLSDYDDEKAAPKKDIIKETEIHLSNAGYFVLNNAVLELVKADPPVATEVTKKP